MVRVVTSSITGIATREVIAPRKFPRESIMGAEKATVSIPLSA